jgi:folylpolyglutamate synthase/dihydropteroate synthase
VGASLSVVAPLEQQYSLSGGQQLHMRLGGAHQLQNASLAVALAARWEAAAGSGHAAQQRQQELSAGVLPAAYAEGIQTCEWPGRSQASGRPYP